MKKLTIIFLFLSFAASAQMMSIVDPLNPSYKKILQNAVDSSVTVPTWATIVAQSGYVRMRISSGAWDRMELMYVYAHDGQQEFGLINWITPGTYNQTKVGTITHADNIGDDSNGSTGYYPTGLDITTSTKWTANNAGYELVTVDNTAASNRYEFGVLGVGSNSLRHNIRNNGSSAQYSINSGSLGPGTYANTDGYWTAWRTADPANQYALLRNDVAVITGSGAGVLPIAGSYVVVFQHNGNFTNRVIRMFSLGAKTQTRKTENYNDWTFYFSQL